MIEPLFSELSSDQSHRKETIYINGQYDTLLFFNWKLEKEHRALHETGHLGLLSHPDVLEECYSGIVQDAEFSDNQFAKTSISR